jgi:hypothetical protein
MSGNDNFGSKSTAKSEWSSAWEAVSRLAATRQTLLEPEDAALSPPVQKPANDHAPNGRRPPQTIATASAQHSTALDHDQLAHALAEIERASAMLRQSEPALEVGAPQQPKRIDGRNYWSVWILISTIWISATLVVASATGAILYLLD